MNKFWGLLFFVVCFIHLPLEASIDNEYGIGGSGIFVGEAKFKNDGITDQHLTFRQAGALMYYIHDLDSNSSITANLGYYSSKISWKQNPEFKKTTYDDIYIAIGGFSDKLDDWVWHGNVYTVVDADELSLSHYAVTGALVWGEYSYSDTIDIYIGVDANSGMKKEDVRPIIGFKYNPQNNWKLNLVYPKDISAVYAFNDRWNLALEGRFFKNRYRTNEKAARSKGIFEYRATGAEFSLNYSSTNSHVNATLLAGTNFGGDLKVRDSAGKNPTFYRLKSATYFGGEIKTTF